VAVDVCLIVVVTTVVDDPEPSVYVRTVSDEVPVSAAPLGPLAAAVGAAVTPVPRGTVDAGVDRTPPDVAVAEYEANAAELADSASATGQTVLNEVSMLSSSFIQVGTHGSKSNSVGYDHLAGRLRVTSRAVSY
jgi:hypothetical protein